LQGSQEAEVFPFIPKERKQKREKQIKTLEDKIER
jgi:hypothetical protein